MVVCACVLEKERLKMSVVSKKMVQCIVANQKREARFQYVLSGDICDHTGTGQLFK